GLAEDGVCRAGGVVFQRRGRPVVDDVVRAVHEVVEGDRGRSRRGGERLHDAGVAIGRAGTAGQCGVRAAVRSGRGGGGGNDAGPAGEVTRLEAAVGDPAGHRCGDRQRVARGGGGRACGTRHGDGVRPRRGGRRRGDGQRRGTAGG